MFNADEPDFIYYDIQFGKGKPRNPQQLTVTFTDESSLNVTYRITPCRGVKMCGSHVQGCISLQLGRAVLVQIIQKFPLLAQVNAQLSFSMLNQLMPLTTEDG